MEIVGSYRRGAESSGDIGVILTDESNDVFEDFVDASRAIRAPAAWGADDFGCGARTAGAWTTLLEYLTRVRLRDFLQPT